MKRSVVNVILICVVTFSTLVVLAGCEQSESDSANMLNENKLLKNEMAKKDSEIQNLQAEILQCRRQKQALANKSASDLTSLTQVMMQSMDEQNTKLKTRIAELEKEIAALKGQ